MLGADAVLLDDQESRRRRAAGRASPARAAIAGAACAMTSGASLPSGNIALSQAPRLLARRAARRPRARTRRQRVVRRRATAITLFSDEQRRRVVEGLRARDLRRGVGDVGGLVDDRRRRCRRRRRSPACRSRTRRARWSASRSRRRGRPARISAKVCSRVTGAGSICTRSRGAPTRSSSACMNSSSSASVDCALRRRRDDDRVAALERVDDVVRRRRAGIGRRRDRGDHADRPRDLDRARARGSSAMTPTDFAPAQVAQQADRLAAVLRDLVGDVAEAGVAHGELGQRAVARRLDDRPAGGGRRPRRRAPASRSRYARCAARARATQRRDDGVRRDRAAGAFMAIAVIPA